MVFRSILLSLALALLLVPAPLRAAQPALIAYRETPAADGSVQVELEFDTLAPQWQIVHVSHNDVKIIIRGVERGQNLPEILTPVGNISSGKIGQLADGLVFDIALNTDIRPHGQKLGKTLIFHFPSKNGDGEAHLKIAAIDAAPGVKMIRLSYADVSEIAGLIKNGVPVPSVDQFTAQSPFAQQVPSQTSSSSYGGGSGQSVASAPTYVSLPTNTLIPKDSAQGVYVSDNVSVDRRLNAVILRGTPEQIAPYEAMIKLVDTPRRSVLLETQIVELTETGGLAFGIDYSPSGSLATATFNSGNTAAAGKDTHPRAGVSIGATLDALQQSGQAKILAQPRILATDNRIAAILSGEAVPIFTTVTIPSGGATVVTQQVQYINVGVSLEILPRISSSGSVTADVFSEVSSIINYVQDAPRIAIRQELTQVSADDGESVLIGGLLQDTEIKNFSKVPILGDIPLLGTFFRDTQISHQKTNLYLIITPHVLTKSTELPKPPAP